MGNIKYMLKPEWVSWESIHECIAKAHETNRKNNFSMQNSSMSVQELKDYLKGGYCFVAIQENKVIGTNSLKVVKSKHWWTKGKIGYECLTAIDPEYRNTGAYFGLRKIRTEFAKSLGVGVLQFDTSEDNRTVQMIDLKFGFRYVSYFASPKTWYYSVVMVKWLDDCPYSKWYCNLRFTITKFLVRLIWKRGHIIRFLPLRNDDYQKIHDKYQLCSDVMSKEEFCKRLGIKYDRFIKWEMHNNIETFV